MGLYKKEKREQQEIIEAEIIINEVKRIKKDQPRIGTRKLQVLLQPKLEKHGIKIGRDGLFDLLREFGLLVKMKRYKHYTTDSKHAFYKYPNRLKEITVTAPNQLWVSDITYIETEGQVLLSVYYNRCMVKENCGLVFISKLRCYRSNRSIKYGITQQ